MTETAFFRLRRLTFWGTVVAAALLGVLVLFFGLSSDQVAEGMSVYAMAVPFLTFVMIATGGVWLALFIMSFVRVRRMPSTPAEHERDVRRKVAHDPFPENPVHEKSR